MGKFYELMKISFKQMFHYRWTFAMTIFTQPILLLINLTLFKSIYAFNHTDSIKGYNLQQMVWYFTAFMVVQAFVYNSVANDISYSILQGDLAMDLLRPYPIFRALLAISVSSRVIALIMDFLPGMVIYSIILPPTFLTPLSFMKFLPLAILAFFINYLFSYIIGMTAIAIKNNSSIIWLNELFNRVAGGALIPLEFFPGWLNGILDFLPFKYIFYWPIQFFLNRETTWQTAVWFRIIGIQLFWIVVLYIACKLLWKSLIRKFCAAGG